MYLLIVFQKKYMIQALSHQLFFFLEMTKPISLLGSHFILLGPVVNAFIQSDDYYRSAQVFEDSKNVELLIQKLETLESKKNHKKRETIER